MSDEETRDTEKVSKIHPHRHLKYMQPDCTMTLREGLEEYYGTIEGLITEDNADHEVAALFHFHDVCHVVFGCDTSPRGEGLADTWSIFGTTVTLKTYQKYLSFQETQSIFASMTFGDMLKMLGESTTAMPQAFWRATHMTHKWPFKDHDQYIDTPLNEIRAEFGIEVIE
ncbi:MAG: hypothetical protein H6719_17590 [Sandaracinaceae bacterium]|nr:hypothetical protein [Sandaracinaceae bacterium]